MRDLLTRILTEAMVHLDGTVEISLELLQEIQTTLESSK